MDPCRSCNLACGAVSCRKRFAARAIDLTRVEKMELHTYDRVRSGQGELTLAEKYDLPMD